MRTQDLLHSMPEEPRETAQRERRMVRTPSDRSAAAGTPCLGETSVSGHLKTNFFTVLHIVHEEGAAGCPFRLHILVLSEIEPLELLVMLLRPEPILFETRTKRLRSKSSWSCQPEHCTSYPSVAPSIFLRLWIRRSGRKDSTWV